MTATIFTPGISLPDRCQIENVSAGTQRSMSYITTRIKIIIVIHTTLSCGQLSVYLPAKVFIPGNLRCHLGANTQGQPYNDVIRGIPLQCFILVAKRGIHGHVLIFIVRRLWAVLGLTLDVIKLATISTALYG